MTTETISLRMDWRACLPMLLAVLESGTPDGRAHARAELRRMAAIADSAVLRSDRARLVRAGAQFAGRLVEIAGYNREAWGRAYPEWQAELAKHKESVRDYWHARLALNAETRNAD